MLFSRAINALCTPWQTADGLGNSRMDILCRERNGVRTGVRWMRGIYAPLITKQDWKNYDVRIVNNGDSGI